jgi:hypothetical protein
VRCVVGHCVAELHGVLVLAFGQAHRGVQWLASGHVEGRHQASERDDTPIRIGSSKGGKATTSLAHAAEGRDLIMHAGIAAIRALQRNDVPPPLLEFRNSHWGKRQLKRDQSKQFGFTPRPAKKSAMLTT